MPESEARCHLTELLVSQCGCREHRPDLTGRPDPPVSREWEGMPVSRVVEAKWSGWCPICGNRYPEGTAIRMDIDGRWVCCGAS